MAPAPPPSPCRPCLLLSGCQRMIVSAARATDRLRIEWLMTPVPAPIEWSTDCDWLDSVQCGWMMWMMRMATQPAPCSMQRPSNDFSICYLFWWTGKKFCSTRCGGEPNSRSSAKCRPTLPPASWNLACCGYPSGRYWKRPWKLPPRPPFRSRFSDSDLIFKSSRWIGWKMAAETVAEDLTDRKWIFSFVCVCLSVCRKWKADAHIRNWDSPTWIWPSLPDRDRRRGAASWKDTTRDTGRIIPSSRSPSSWRSCRAILASKCNWTSIIYPL